MSNSLKHMQKVKTSVKMEHSSDAYLKFHLLHLPFRCHKNWLISMLQQMRTEMSSILFKASLSKEGNNTAYLGQ